MKTTALLVLFTVSLLCSVSCKKNDSNSNLSAEERKLLGNWLLKKRVVEAVGQPAAVELINDPISCFMDFRDQSYSLNQGLYANTKWSQDNKNCNWVANAWKIEATGQLFLASLDTVHADILILGADTLAFKTVNPQIVSQQITYQFSR